MTLPPGDEAEHDTEPVPRIVELRLPPPTTRRRRPTRWDRLRRTVGNQPLIELDLPPEQMAGSLPPSPVVVRYLFTTERFRGEWRRHWTYLWREIGAVAAATLGCGYIAGTFGGNLPGVFGLLWLVVTGWAGWRWADWWYDRFVLTNKRVMIVSGLVTRRVAMMPLKRVTDMAYRQGLIGRSLDYGTFVLESAGQDQALRVITHLPRPNDLYLHICEEMYARGGGRDDDEDA